MVCDFIVDFFYYRGSVFVKIVAIKVLTVTARFWGISACDNVGEGLKGAAE